MCRPWWGLFEWSPRSPDNSRIGLRSSVPPGLFEIWNCVTPPAAAALEVVFWGGIQRTSEWFKNLKFQIETKSHMPRHKSQSTKDKTNITLCRHSVPSNHQPPATNHLSPLPALPMIQLIQVDLAAERIAVNSQQPRGARLVAMKTFEHALDEFLFKFVDRFVELDSTIHHQANQRFQLLLHRSTLRTRVVRRRRIPAARLAEFMAR
jgi:hypothetical protein